MPTQIDFSGGKTPVPPIRFNPKMVYIGIAVLVGLWLLSGVYTVAPDEKAVILRFGKLQEVVDPGLHYHWRPRVDGAKTDLLAIHLGDRTDYLGLKRRRPMVVQARVDHLL